MQAPMVLGSKQPLNTLQIAVCRTYNLILATQEVAATSTTKPPTKDVKDDVDPDDLDTTIPRSGRNNLEEAADFVKRVNTITDTFVDNLSDFNRHTLQDNYMNFIHELHRALVKLDSTYFGDANPKLVLKLVDDKLCKAYRNRPREGIYFSSHRYVLMQHPVPTM